MLSKPGCQLCIEAIALLRGLQLERRLAVEVENVQDDPAQYERYRDRIPVLVFDEHTIVEPPFDAKRIRAVLDRLDQEARIELRG